MKSNVNTSHLISHLYALRRCLGRSILSIVFFFSCLVYWAPDLFRIFAQPLLRILPNHHHMIATDVLSAFTVPMQTTLILAFILALPYILYQFWNFVAPGLYAKEKSYLLPLIISNYLLFLLGVFFAYFILFPNVFRFLVGYNAAIGTQMATDISKYFSFAYHTFLVFGFSFQLPVVLIVLIRAQIVTREKLQTMRPYMIVLTFIIAAVLTPPDVLSQFLLAIPLCLLFECGLFFSRYFLTNESDLN